MAQKVRTDQAGKEKLLREEVHKPIDNEILEEFQRLTAENKMKVIAVLSEFLSEQEGVPSDPV